MSIVNCFPSRPDDLGRVVLGLAFDSEIVICFNISEDFLLNNLELVDVLDGGGIKGAPREFWGWKSELGKALLARGGGGGL